jgi:hypothetical protein
MQAEQDELKNLAGRARPTGLLDVLPCILVLGIVLAVTGYYLAIPARELAINHEDDSQYYTKIAHNFAAGHPFTFDRIGRTNGFHPLWMLCSTALAVFEPHPLAFQKLYFGCEYLIFLACTAFLYAVAMRITGKNRLISAAAALYFGLDEYFHATILNGLETPQFVLMCLICLLAFMRSGDSTLTSAARAFGLGLLLSLLVLARLDGGLIAATAITVAFLIARRATLSIGQISAILAGVILPTALYAWLSYSYCGSVLPVSGLAKVARIQSPSEPWPIATIDFTTLYNWHAYYPERLANALQLDGWLGELDRLGRSYYISRASMILFSAFISLSVYGVFLRLCWSQRRVAPRSGIVLVAFALSAAITVAFNKALNRNGVIPYWYPVSFSLAQLLMIAGMLSRLQSKVRGATSTIIALAALLAALYPFLGIHQNREAGLRTNVRYAHWYDTALWIRDNTPTDTVASAYNAGIIGSFSERSVINLDGVVNTHAFLRDVASWEQKDSPEYKLRLIDFLVKNRVRYFADELPGGDVEYWPKFFESPGQSFALKQVYRTPSTIPGHAAVFEIVGVDATR